MFRGVGRALKRPAFRRHGMQAADIAEAGLDMLHQSLYARIFGPLRRRSGLAHGTGDIDS